MLRLEAGVTVHRGRKQGGKEGGKERKERPLEKDNKVAEKKRNNNKAKLQEKKK